MAEDRVRELRRAALVALRDQGRADVALEKAMRELLEGDPAVDPNWDVPGVEELLKELVERSVYVGGRLLHIIASLPGREALAELIAEVRDEDGCPSCGHPHDQRDVCSRSGGPSWCMCPGVGG